MGYRVQLIAVTGKEHTAIQREYGVEPTGHHEETPESPVVGAILPNGAYLLYVNDEVIPDHGVFNRLSQRASLVACYVNETVSSSYACGWDNGVENWSVFHDAQKAILHLEINGTPPPEFDTIRDRLFSQQVGCDDTDYIFDIPVELFAANGGIRYDQNIPGADSDPWEVLKRKL